MGPCINPLKVKEVPLKEKFAGPCAQGVLDTVIVPRPMSLGCSGLIDSIVLFKDNAFLGTSAHESVTLAGYLLATCWLPVDSRCVSRPFLGLKNPSETRIGPAWPHLGVF